MSRFNRKLNHNRPISYGDVYYSEEQYKHQNGHKNPPKGSMGGMLDIGCKFSQHALEERERIFNKHKNKYDAIKEIREIRRRNNMKNMKANNKDENNFFDFGDSK